MICAFSAGTSRSNVRLTFRALTDLSLYPRAAQPIVSAHQTRSCQRRTTRFDRRMSIYARFIDPVGMSHVSSRRSKPSSRTALMGEQPNPWDLLQPQDATSRHRGAKPSRRYGLLGKMSLLSPGYLLSVERRRFHTQPPDHYALLSHLLDLSVSQSSSLVPLHSTADCQPA